MRIIYSLFTIEEVYDASAFRAFAEMARGFGATHVNIGVMPNRYSWFLPDNEDPYASWQNFSMGLFRVMTPPALHEWIPQDEAEFQLDVLKKKVEVLRDLGLRATVSNGVEPCWLPEDVYRAHPDWRGAQCELGRIANRPYFTPSIDHPDVLELYRWSIEQLCRLLPEIDEFQFLSNDSGAGISWSANTYPGINGPTAYRSRGFGSRIAGWLKAMREGAESAGSRARFNVHSVGFTPTEREAATALLDTNTYVSSMNGDGRPWCTAHASFGADFWSPTWPVPGIHSPRQFVAGLEKVYAGGEQCDEGAATIQIDGGGLPLARVLLESFLERRGPGLLRETEVLLRAAATFVGEERADALVKAWEDVDRAVLHMSSVFDRGMSVTVPWGAVCSRWLIRPLVPQPEELTAEETAHYYDNMFSAADGKRSANLCYILGKPVLNGASAVWMARWNLQKAIDVLNRICAGLDAVCADAGENAGIGATRLYRDRLKALSHVVENAKLTILYQHALNTAHIPRFGSNSFDMDDNMQYDQRCLELRRIARADIDNTAALLELLQSSPEPLIATAETPAGETVFKFGPDLPGALRRKMDIMLDHWQDYERLYPTAREKEFEPEVRPDDEG